ncbi:lysylphosphatidylglycerol synthase transmembrane domain-containing protein [Crassaminicella profunda]|uniref:lysylphosphatidylglycerol synthase transmembrane domain-containing protein n=1 Tax=Crassaminicella profunda TaxID=1286698 RepID=UPI001CA71265|nr:lysylphosphatidylglycerol synthase transmembrane domain-containing protein [Crassaminicella profunda]QZY56392.1 flippase-like domain-containing protein [Crassaminicella profunda]
MIKKSMNYVVLFLLIILTFWILIANNDFSRLPYLLTKIDKGYFSLAIGCMLLYWIVNTIILIDTSKMVYSQLTFKKAFKITMIGQYYSAITPFASGGQPAQIYYMTKDKICTGKGTSILMIKFMIYQMVVTVYAIIMFLLKWNDLSKDIAIALPFILTGICISFIGIFMIFLLFFNENIVGKIFNMILKHLKKFNNVNNLERKLEEYLVEYTESIKELKKHRGVAIKLSCMTFLQLTCYFSITYFIYIAFGLKDASIIDIIALQSLLYMAVSFIPTPGTVGASEGGFHILFSFLFKENFLIYAMLLWRIISYYSCIIIGGLTTLLIHFKESKKKATV